MASSTQQAASSYTLLASALTPVHAGAGRSPGIVDLPIVRDPMGYPFIRGSMIKGAIKTLLLNKNKCVKKDVIKVNGKEQINTIVDCSSNSSCRKICCALGPEAKESTKGASKYAILDLYPLVIPAPAGVIEGGISLGGIVYVTTPALLARAASLAGFDLNNIESWKAVLYHEGANGTASILVASRAVKVSLARPDRLPSGLGELLALAVEKGLHPLYKVYRPTENLLVVPDNTGRQLIDSLLYRVTRVRLDKVTKTVQKGALWTEEYLPWATLLLGKIIDTGFENAYCHGTSADINELLKGVNSIVVGGKETVGAGLLKIAIA